MHDPPLDLHRQSPRLRGHDYGQAGAYFVSICAHNRVCLFGEIVNCKMLLNGWGRLVKDEWARIHQLRQKVELDAFIIMPNHVHGIICINDNGAVPIPDVGARRASPLRMGGVRPGSLGAIVGSFKSASSRMINLQRETPGNPVWQRNYHEHIIRDERELEEIREYITNNPAKWAEDGLNPNNVGAQHAAPLRPVDSDTPSMPFRIVPGSLGAVVRSFKSAGTRLINLQRDTPGNLLWQRNYHEHIVRSGRELKEIREYIINNPARWAEDEFNPQNVGARRAVP